MVDAMTPGLCDVIVEEAQPLVSLANHPHQYLAESYVGSPLPDGFNYLITMFGRLTDTCMSAAYLNKIQ